MTKGEQLIESLSKKTSFYDGHERRAYLRFIEIAKRIIDDPSVIESGVSFAQKYMKGDSHQANAYARWKEVLKQPPQTIAKALLEDSETGQALRDTAPVFVVVDKHAVQEIWHKSP